jgi:hypothetical protein
MKKIVTLAFILILAISFGYCGGDKPQVKDVPKLDDAKTNKKPNAKDAFKVRERDFK